MNATLKAPLATADNGGPETTANILALDLPKRRQHPAPAPKHRFKLLQFQNRGGSVSWRVSGCKRDGTRIRENHLDQRTAQCRQAELEAEFYHRQPDEPMLRATKLSEMQLRLCETALPKLENDDDLLLAVQFWLKHGRKETLAQSPRLDDAVAQFQTWLDGTPTLRPKTKANLRVRLNVFANSVGNLYVRDITPDTVEDYLAKRQVSALTKDTDRRVISRFFSWCIERPRRWTMANPAREVKVERGAPLTPTVLSVADCTKLMRRAEQYEGGLLVPYLAVTMFAGLRPTEAARLTWSVVNLEDAEIRLEGEMTKTGRSRVVSIGPTLKAWLVTCKGREFYPANFRKHFAVIQAAIGKAWVHDVLRHTSISHFFRECGSYGRTAEQFGNSEAIIKQHYQGRVSSEDTKAFYAIVPTAKKGASK